ncbi:TolC family protein [Roseiconus lacunae]|uniref:TolC family protein n=1 Tax=Roseiconus lacunae TaxID=2605694 RepID=UPI001E4B3061|nr:TolC family protein [Roseiconus lacunae]
MRALQHYLLYATLAGNLLVVSWLTGCASTSINTSMTALSPTVNSSPDFNTVNNVTDQADFIDENHQASCHHKLNNGVKRVNFESIAELIESDSDVIQTGQASATEAAERMSVDSAASLQTNASTNTGTQELTELIDMALRQNPLLTKLESEYHARAARSHYVDKLPDPKFSVNAFGNPIETAAGSQRANIGLSQTIPWLEKLSAQQKQVCLEAMAIAAEHQRLRLEIDARLRTAWASLYVIERQRVTTEANRQLLQSMIDVASARFAIGTGSHGDVLLGTIEQSKLEERLLQLEQRKRTNLAQLNRWVGRPANTAVLIPQTLPLENVQVDAEQMFRRAISNQPEIHAARLRSQATRWGIEVARLSHRPEFTLSASYFATDDNRPRTPVVNVGEDPWAIGLQMTLPVSRQKYNAIRREASWQHQAAHQQVEALIDQYDALIVELYADATRAYETASLYKSTIIPQARQTLTTNQEAFANGTVDYDQVLRDYQTLLTLELGLHQAIGDLFIVNAKIHQAAGGVNL